MSRPSATARGYGYVWQQRRIAFLATHPWCEGGPELHAGHGHWWHRATDVDHIIPLSQGGPDERTNLQPLCKRAHSSKTAQENAVKRAVEHDYPSSAWDTEASA